jgi:hypothetical protein
LKTLELLDVLIDTVVLQRTETAQHLVQLPRVELLPLHEASKLLRVRHPLSDLAAELAHVLRVVAAGTSVPATPRLILPAADCVARSATAISRPLAIVPTAFSTLPLLSLLTLLSLLALPLLPLLTLALLSLLTLCLLPLLALFLLSLLALPSLLTALTLLLALCPLAHALVERLHSTRQLPRLVERLTHLIGRRAAECRFRLAQLVADAVEGRADVLVERLRVSGLQPRAHHRAGPSDAIAHGAVTKGTGRFRHPL